MNAQGKSLKSLKSQHYDYLVKAAYMLIGLEGDSLTTSIAGAIYTAQDQTLSGLG